MAITLEQASSKPQQSRPEINITPLVDVVLVLLIIFMVIAPALEHGERVELPSVANADAQEKAQMDPITLTIAASGSVYWEKELVTEDVVAVRAKEQFEQNPSRRVVIKGDGNLPYGRARRVFALVQDAGITHCALVVQKKKDPS
jgi:biopolymer transport protein TolR